jgi:hypothetical protein
VEESVHAKEQRRGGLATLRRTSLPALVLVLALVGCAATEAPRVPPPPHPAFGTATAAMRAEREADMNRQWQNKRLDELVDAYGRPKLVMSIPGGGVVPSFAVVYGTDPNSGCIDAFAVLAVGTPLVRDYYCR